MSVIRPWQALGLDLDRVVEWISSIPFSAWPQQHRLADGRERPAFVTDPKWNAFGATTDRVVDLLMVGLSSVVERSRWLSAIMPGAGIQAHADAMPEDWLTRVHVPLVTNDDAFFIADGAAHRMRVGFAYLVDVGKRHSVWNAGATPRVHLMFDVHRAS